MTSRLVRAVEWVLPSSNIFKGAKYSHIFNMLITQGHALVLIKMIHIFLPLF